MRRRMSPTAERRWGGASALSLITILTAFVACAALSWRRLGSLVIDGGHELEVPRRLLEGAALYRDVRWYWGPLAPWLNSALYGLFGVRYDTLMWAGLVTAALAALGLYLISRRFLGSMTSAWVVVAFLVACAFARRIPTAIFNFVLPFNFSATYGITLAMWSVLLLLRHAETGGRRTLAASAVLAGLVALTKAETTLAVGTAHVAFLLTLLPRPSIGRILAWLGGVGVAAGGYLVAALASDGLVWPSLVALASPASRFYISSSMGLEEPGFAIGDAALSAAGWAVISACVYWAARRAAATGRRAAPGAVLACAVAFAIPAFLLQANFFRAAPFVAAGVLAWILVGRAREGETALGGRWREHAVLWAFSLAAFARIPLRAGPDHYGFYLLPPFLICLAVAVTRYLGARGLEAPASRRVLAAGASAALAGVSAGAFLISYPQLTRPTTELNTARVRLEVDADGPEAAFVPMLSRLPPETVCAAVPEGAGLVFAAGLTPTADGMLSYLPMDLPDAAAERAALAAWERVPPALIVYWGQNQGPVFGGVGFGHDYALDVGRWIVDRYEPYGDPVGGMLLFVPRRDRPLR